ncbi:MAG: hypothetical protein K6G07_00800 [Lachnospiraceae bacterium]|nr:hypothetical protein [Lachnospiraceae bacterium]
MGLTERILKETKKAEDRKNKPVFYEEDEEYYMYMPYQSQGFINENKGVFANDDDTSINTAKSIFDKTAVFKTKKTEE